MAHDIKDHSKNHWQCGSITVSVGQLPLGRPLIMGILNVTPDSFSDGGQHNQPDSAFMWATKLAAQGADIIDVGGESTRPGASTITAETEKKRVLPIVRRLAASGYVVSIDTRHAEVAQACVEAGAAIINDVSGFRDPAMVEVACACNAGLVVMHMLGEPHNMQVNPHYTDVVSEVGTYLVRQARMLEAAGVDHERIVIDPGVGFGKTYTHNLQLLRATKELAEIGYPLMVATSRKKFIGEATGVRVAADRLAGSLTSALWALAQGASIARVHDVAATVEALRMLQAIYNA